MVYLENMNEALLWKGHLESIDHLEVMSNFCVDLTELFEQK